MFTGFLKIFFFIVPAVNKVAEAGTLFRMFAQFKLH